MTETRRWLDVWRRIFLRRLWSTWSAVAVGLVLAAFALGADRKSVV